MSDTERPVDTSSPAVGAPATGTSSTAAATIAAEADPVKTLELKPLVVEAISTVYDPEIPVNIFELGLIYDIVIDAQGVVHVAMTLTSPACPSAQQIPVEVATKVRAIPGVTDADVQIVWEPPWAMDKMSDAARLQLGIGW
jgi:FeS assembly SUF system protein